MTGKELIDFIISQGLEDYEIGLQGEAGDIEWIRGGIVVETDHDKKTAVIYYHP